jgi:hypothetical protein
MKNIAVPLLLAGSARGQPSQERINDMYKKNVEFPLAKWLGNGDVMNAEKDVASCNDSAGKVAAAKTALTALEGELAKLKTDKAT